MKTKPDNTLTAEERELAQLSRRLGPQGEPSPALDARILGAARAAVAKAPARKPKPMPRWPVAIGLAASVVFAVGIAWQLRPLQQAATVTEAPVAYSRSAPTAAASADSRAVAEQTRQTAEDSVNADSVNAESVSVEAVVAESPAAVAPAPGAPALKAGPVPAVTRRPPTRPVPRASPAPAAPVARESTEPRSGTRAAAPPPPPPPAVPTVSAVAAEAAPDFVADAPAEAPAGQQAAAAQEALRSANAAAKQSALQDQTKASASASASAVRETENRALQRVEVSGSRLKRTDLQVPVAEDAQLAVEEWLERVRTRYGLGDAGAARQSLLLFVKDHPGEPIPGDLEPLLEK